MASLENTTALLKDGLLFAVDGLPQRQKMCDTCPGRKEMGSGDKILPHRCHTVLNAICADALLNSPEGRWVLLKQVEQENGRVRRAG